MREPTVRSDHGAIRATRDRDRRRERDRTRDRTRGRDARDRLNVADDLEDDDDER
jgi:hypothetical protein